jgi:hypothetical protein
MQPVCVQEDEGLNLQVGNIQDDLVMGCIQRANLDVFWSRATDTVKGNFDNVKWSQSISLAIGLEGPLESHGPLLGYDHCGYDIFPKLLCITYITDILMEFICNLHCTVCHSISKSGRVGSIRSIGTGSVCG